MSPSHPVLTRFRARMGQRCVLHKRSWRVVDLLFADGCLVLESLEATPPIQADQYGNAASRAPDHLELRLFKSDGELTVDARRLLDSLENGASARRATG